ncbi:MAG: VWA domain-containing protein [Bacteroidetes bacterium]|nr:VWA domain-containing protein [Bacteroidota bacterium]MDA0859519.1 VWA domain-containing protein [Bacteroidota bacterium]MDA1317895.1 VWA domain-containing protein [Bacteroidota bacterium]
MTTPLVLFGSLAIVIAFILALFQYKPWISEKVYWVLTAARTLALSALFLLLINPETNIETIEVIKPKLGVLVDNSQSIKFLKKDSIARVLLNQIKSKSALSEKFDLHYFTFDNALYSDDSLSFDASQTNIGKSLIQAHEIFKDEVAPMLLLSDGNQTLGTSYGHIAKQFSSPIYPLVLGDTIQYIDLKIKQINVNTYTFLENTFPVEIFINYNGNDTKSTVLEIFQDETLVYKEKLQFSALNNSKVITPKLKASKVGFQRFSARLRPLTSEKVVSNNSKTFAIEVLDQKLKIALISKNTHPDIGVFNSVISSQKNYTFKRYTPEEFLKISEEFAFVILYQPDYNFRSILEQTKKINTFIIGGISTEWSFLNANQPYFKQEVTKQKEAYQAAFNTDFDAFSITPLSFEDYPPLQSEFGKTEVSVPHQILLYKSINGRSSQMPLMFSYTNEGVRNIVLLGEDIWKWRLKSFQLDDNSEKFDAFFSAIFQYLSTQKTSKRLVVTHNPVFDGSVAAEIFAQFYDENFQFNPNASLDIEISSPQIKTSINYPLVVVGDMYKVDLSGLKSGKYTYKIKTRDQQFSTSGQFEILEFNVEAQFFNSDYQQLLQLTSKTRGHVFLENEFDNLLDELLNNPNYKSVQRINKKTVPLINYKLLLLLIILSLALEWFIRKYKGLI